MTIRQAWMLAAALCAVSSASGAALPCVNNTLAGYQALAMGCTIGETAFADFNALPAPSVFTAIDPASVQVTPLLSGNTRGFRFDFNQTAATGDLVGILIGYTVGLTNGASLELNGSVVTPDGVNTGILNVCSGDFVANDPFNCTGASDLNIAVDDGVTTGFQFASLALPPSAYDVLAELVIDGGTAGSATLASATVLHTVPEPATWSVMLMGLAWAGLRRMKKNKEDK